MIDSYSFGRITIKGKDYEDIKIIGKKVVDWQYIEHHTVTEGDVIDVFNDKPEYVVIGIGSSGLVHVTNEAINLAKEKHIKLLILDTRRACEEFNKLYKQGKRVNAIMHATC